MKKIVKKLLLMLCAVICMSALSAQAFADDQTAGSDVVYCESLEEAGAALRAQLKARQEVCVVGYLGDNAPAEADIWNQALAHTGVPDEGDYLKSCIKYQAHYANDGFTDGYIDFQYEINVSSVTEDGLIYTTYTYTVTYRTTAEQEREVDEAAAEVLKRIRTDCEANTLLDIFNYICNIPYDSYHLNNDADYEYEQTAYGALIRGSAVCEGFSALFYRLALECGIETRLVYGAMPTWSTSAGHAWNMVRVGDKYYTLDATNGIYMITFTEEYEIWSSANEEGFESSHPLSETPYKPVIDYSFDSETGILTIRDQALPDVYYRNIYVGEDKNTYPWSDEIRLGTKSVVFEKELTGIGTGIFENFISLETVSVPETVTYIGDRAFYQCASADIQVPENLELTYLGAQAFYNCTDLADFPLEKQTNLTEIKEETFSGTGLQTVTIPENIENIGQYAFSRCREVTQVTFPQTSFFSIGDTAFMDCEKLEYLELSDNVGNIGRYAFAECFSLAEVVLPDNITQISDWMFYRCSSLSGLLVPDSVKTIGEGAFSETGLTSFYITEYITNIGSQAFRDSSVKYIVVSPENKYFSSADGVLFNKEKTELIYYPGYVKSNRNEDCYIVPEGISSIAPYAFYGAHFNTDTSSGSQFGVVLPDGLISIGEYAFYDSNISSINIPDTVTSIGKKAFQSCDNLISAFVGNGVAIINAETFCDCNMLTDVFLTESLKTIDNMAFARCRSLKTISVPESTSRIGCGVFADCSNLAEISLGTAMRSIEESAFASTALSKVYYTGSQSQWNKIKIADTGNDLLKAAEIIFGDNINTKEIAVYFDTNGGDLESGSMTVLAGGSYGELPVPKKEGSEFYGWFTDPEGGVPINADTAVLVSGDHTLYAHWEDTLTSSGTAGDNILWAIHSTGELAVYGSGAIPAMGDEESCPWWGERFSVTSISISGEIDAIGEAVFFLCMYAERVSIPDTVRVIGRNAFFGCSSIAEITIPNGVEEIGEGAFQACYGLVNVSLPDSLKTIGDCAFGKTPSNSGGITIATACTSLASISIPDSVESVGIGVFCGCTALKEADVSFAGESMFEGCTALETVNIRGNSSGNRAIGRKAFEGCSSLVNVIISDSVTAIGWEAFTNCSALESIVIPDSVTSIGKDAFKYLPKLKTVTIGSGIVELGGQAFYSCPALEEIVIRPGCRSIGSFTFYNCSSLSSVTIPDTVLSIGEAAFCGCTSLEALSLPSKLEDIGINAFQGCENLREVTVPQNVRQIGVKTFADCLNLGTVSFLGTPASVGNSAFQNCGTLHTVYWYGTEDEWAAMSVGENNDALLSAQLVYKALNEITVEVSFEPNGGNLDPLTKTVTFGGEYGELPVPVREGCRFKGWYTEPNGGTKITETSVVENGEAHTLYARWLVPVEGGACGDELTWTLYSDGSLEITGSGTMDEFSEAPWYPYRYNIVKIQVGEKVKSISAGAFKDCNVAVWAELADVESIGSEAFRDCTGLVRATATGTPDIGGYAFYGCSSLCSFSAPGGSSPERQVSVGEYAFYGCGHLNQVSIPYETIAIGDYAFDGVGVASIVIPDNVTSIGNYAFSGCSAKEIHLPSNLSSLGEYAFNYCMELTEIRLPDGLTSIGKYAFSNCRALRTMYLPEGIICIPDDAFIGCFLLESVNIPDTVTSIGDSAFYQCEKLTSIRVPGGVSSIGNYAFYGCRSLTDVELPDTLTSVGNYVFYSCSALTKMPIPNNWTSIPCGMFKGCTGLTSLEFPEQITKIESNAFSDCTGLTTVEIPERINSIGDSAFRGCTNLVSVSLPSSMTVIEAWTFVDSGLTSITIPESIDLIGYCAFSGCSDLTEVIFLGEAPQIKNTMWTSDALSFENVTATVYYPDELDKETVTWTDDVMQDYGGTLTWQSWYTLGSVPNCQHSYTTTEVRGECDSGYTLNSCACGYSYRSNVVLDGHSYEEAVTEPTCTEQGYTTHTCSKCGDSYIDSYVDALGHTEVADAAVEPDCTTEGLTAGSHCSVCGLVLVEQETIPAKGHSWDEGEETTAPDCENSGLRSYSCSVCGAEKTENIPALGHEPELRNEKAASCTEPGYTGDSYCKRCGVQLSQGEEIAQLAHEYTEAVGELHLARAATCTESAVYYVSCRNCGANGTETFSAGEPLGHLWDNDCDTDCNRCGLTRETSHAPDLTVWQKDAGGHWHVCTSCGEQLDYAAHTPGAEATEESAQVCTVCGYEIVPPLGHTHTLVFVEAKAAICVEEGNTAYWYCSGCSGLYSDEAATIPVERSATVLPIDPDNHGDGAETVNSAAASCTEAGYTGDVVCKNCGVTISVGEVIPAAGHRWDEGTVTKEATTEEEGEMTYTCTVCQATKTAVIPRITGYRLTGTAISWDGNGNELICLYSSMSEDEVKTDIASGAAGARYTAQCGEAEQNEDGKRFDLAFSFADVEAGEYILAIYKPGNYVLLTASVTVSGDAGLGEFALQLAGDLSGDGNVNTMDLIRLMKYISGVEVDVAPGTADVNGDGRENTMDLIRLMKIVNGEAM